MCYDEGTLRAHLDRALPARETERVAAHLAGCSRCRITAERLRADADLVAGVLERSLDEAGVRRETLLAAWAGLRETGRPETVWKGVRAEMRRFKVAAVVAATVCALAVPFSFAPVRAMATQFLNVFRVERVHVVNISPQEIAQIQRAMEGEGIANLNIENFGRVSSNFDPQPRAASLEEVEKAIGPGFKVPVLSGAGEPSWELVDGGSLTIAPDVEAINGMLARFGNAKLLPESLDGKEFTLTQHPVAMAEFRRPDGRTVVVAQGKSPELAVPDGTDVLALRDALLGLPFLPDNIRRQLEAVSDWQSTVLIPNVEGEVQPVPVNGSEGAFISGPDGDGGCNTLVWAGNGLVYMAGGEGLTLDEALAAAASLR